MMDEEVPTLAELLSGGPLTGARVSPGAGLDRPVREVRIVDDLTRLAQLTPDCVVVLTARAVRGEWGVETALRGAWERAAAGVVSPEDAVRTPSPDLIAARLRIPLVTITDDPYQVALALARAVGKPSAARAEVVARCAAALSELTVATPRKVLDTLTSTVSGVRFALVSKHHGLLAGHASVQRALGDEDADGADSANRLVRHPVPGAWPGEMSLAATLTTRSAGLAETTRVALALAASLLAANMTTRRLSAERDASVAAGVLDRLLHEIGDSSGAVDDELAAAAAAYGWPLAGRMLPLAMTTVSGGGGMELGAAVPAAWASGAGEPLVTRHRDAWVSWRGVGAEEDAAAAMRSAAEDLTERLARMRGVAPLVGGVGPVADGPDGLPAAVLSASRAAAFARHGGAGQVELASTISPRALLVALPVDELTGAAGQAMANLLDVDTDGSLLRTLAELLDAGGATRVAAARLGVHRNTVTSRAQRLRELGLDTDDLPDRLAVHLACHLLLRASSGGSRQLPVLPGAQH